MIDRTVSNDLLKLLKSFSSLAILGPRQVGKTTLAKSIINKLNIDCIYLDLELQTDAQKLERDAEAFLKANVDRCVIIDEVQRMPSLFPLLRAMIDMNKKPARYILLGSANPSVIKYSSESLAGRIIYTELTPFNLTEIPNPKEQDRHWLLGGFPDPFLANTDVALRWLKSFIKTYVERDLPLLGLAASPVLVERFWRMLASRQGGLWNASDFARSLGVTHPTVNNLVDYFEGAYLVNRLHPYFINVGKRLVKSPKLYIRDSGVLHSLSNVNSIDELYGNALIGASWEGYVIEQIKQLCGDEFSIFFYRTHVGAECDLLLERGGKPVAGIEIKFTSAPSVSRGFVEAMKDLKTEKNFIITPSSDAYTTSHNIQVCNLYDFLTTFLKVI